MGASHNRPFLQGELNTLVNLSVLKRPRILFMHASTHAINR